MGTARAHKMKGKFAILLSKTGSKLKDKINWKEFQTYLASYFPEECIPESPDVNKVFDAISRHKLWDYLNYNPFKQIVKHFADQEVKSWLKAYEQDLKFYKASTKLPFEGVDSDSSDESISEEEQQEQCKWPEKHEECYDQQYEQCRQSARYDRRYYQELLIKVNKKFTDHSLIDVEELWKNFADICGLPFDEVLLERSVGCISIVWLIPSHLAPQLLSTAPHSVNFYRQHEITRVEFDGKCIYPEQEKQHEVHYCVCHILVEKMWEVSP